ncbi:MAG: hypothetical protein QM773_14415 [Hyphomonadaceae bacterium]
MPNDLQQIGRRPAILLAQIITPFDHSHELLPRGFIAGHLHAWINALLALLALHRTYGVVRLRALARRVEALRNALVHAGDCAKHVARAIARRLAEAHRPIPNIRLRRRRMKRGENTLASRLVGDFFLTL